MHPSTAQARVIVDELARCGVRHVVICPGSRNAPLSMAAFGAAGEGRITLHVRVDERSAGFLALGIGKAGAGPAVVCCTSGTAVANLHPAVLEAHHSRTPLVALTADRPAELWGTGANQTIDQRGIYGGAAAYVELPLAERGVGGNAIWRSTVARAVARAHAGAVQLNVPLREPLVPAGDADWPEPLTGRDGPWTSRIASTTTGPAVELSPRTLVVAGDPLGEPERVRAVAAVAAAAGWPVVAEPTATAAALAGGAEVLASGSLLLNAGAVPSVPVDVAVVGRPTLTRGVGALLRNAGRVVLVAEDDWTDPQHVAARITGAVSGGAADPEWLSAWQAADKAASAAVDRVMGTGWPTGAHAARDVVAALPAGSGLFLGSSNAVRFVDFVAPTGNRAVLANRGVAGIDGSVSTAAGIALGSGRPWCALLGDLTFLHDVNGLLLGPDEQRPDLTVVVLNDDGGGIFGLLEQGAPEHAGGFERVFGTPTGADLGALCAGYGVPHTLVSDRDGLAAALAPAAGPRVVEIRVGRAVLRDWQATLFAAVRAAAG